MTRRKNELKRKKIVCAGKTRDGVRIADPMRATLIVRQNPQGCVALLYKPRSRALLGAFTLADLIALEVAVPKARLELYQLMLSIVAEGDPDD